MKAEPAQAELCVAEMVGKLMHFWGFKRPMGRLWTVLYLSPVPLSASELCLRLGMSAGGVSMALSSLEKWGCVHRAWVPGQRRDFFSAEDDIWKMVQRVLAQRERLLVSEFADALEDALSALESAQPQAPDADPSWKTRTSKPGDEHEELGYKRRRLTKLLELTATGQTLLSALVAGNAVDPTSLIQAPSAGAPADSTRAAPSRSPAAAASSSSSHASAADTPPPRRASSLSPPPTLLSDS